MSIPEDPSLAPLDDKERVVTSDNPLVTKFYALNSTMGHVLSRIRGSQFSRNMGAGSVMAILGTCLSLVSYPIYLHYLGYHRYGLWLVLSVVVSVAQLGNLGIPWALMKLVAEDHGHGDWEGVKTYVNIGCGIIVGIGLMFYGAVVLLRSEVLHWFKLSGADATAVYSMLPYVAILSVLVLLFSTFNAALGGLGRMDLTSYNETLVQVFIIFFCSGLLYLGLDLRGMVFGTLSGYVVAQVISFVQVQRIMPIPLAARTRISSYKAKQLLGTGGWILAGGMFAIMLFPFTRLMMSRYAGLEAVAVNDMCLTGSMRIRNIFDAAFRPMMPEVSSFLPKGDANAYDRVRSIDRRAFLVILTLALPTFIGLIVIMNPLLHIWLHRSFNSLLPSTFRIALIGAFVSLLGSSAYYVLIGLGKARDSAYSTGIQFTVNSLLLLAMATLFGKLTVGQAAIAFGIATGASTLYLRARLYVLARPRASVPSHSSV